jgi:hypothetical protein
MEAAMAFGTWNLLRRGRATSDPSDFGSRLQQLKRASDVAGLIDLLKRSDRAHKDEVVAVLREVTGRDLGIRARLWRRWLENGRAEDRRTAGQWIRHAASAFKVTLVTGSLGLLYWIARRRRHSSGPGL